MNGVKSAAQMSGMLKSFSDEHKNRLTRMGVFEPTQTTVVDYWLEDGLPLTGVDVEPQRDGTISVRILLSNKENTEASHYTHAVEDAKLVKLLLSSDGESDGLDIVGSDGRTTILRFENF